MLAVSVEAQARGGLLITSYGLLGENPGQFDRTY